jgi:hypothetical protein
MSYRNRILEIAKQYSSVELIYKRKINIKTSPHTVLDSFDGTKIVEDKIFILQESKWVEVEDVNLNEYMILQTIFMRLKYL